MSGKYELIYDASSGRQLLHEELTGQKILLDAGATWTLHTDQDEEAFVHAEHRDPMYCYDAVSDVVFAPDDAPHDLHVLVDGSTPISLWEYKRRHTPVSVKLQVGGASTVATVKTYKLHQAVGGTFILWSVPEVFKLGHIGQSLTCSQWCQSWWQWWEKSLMAMGACAELHLRKSMTTGARNQYSVPADDTGPRFLHEKCFSTLALIHVLVRASAPSRGSKDKSQEQMQSWSMVGAAVVRKFLNGLGDVEQCIYLDPAVQARVGLPASGSNPCQVHIRDGRMDLSAVASSDLPSIRDTVQTLRKHANIDNIPIMEALALLSSAGVKARWLYMQLLYAVVTLVECSYMREHNTEQPEEVEEENELCNTYHERKDHRQKKAKHRMELSRFCWRDKHKSALRAFYSLREYFASEQIVSLAVDASRIGGLQRVVSYLCRPDGFGLWLPPQASHICHTHPLHHNGLQIWFPVKIRLWFMYKKLLVAVLSRGIPVEWRGRKGLFE
eukprot:6485276-Amphidinium_carterae.1